MTREKFITRTLYLTHAGVKDTAIAAIEHLPVDPVHPIEIRFAEKSRKRTLDQNARMWAGPLKDMAEQAWMDGKSYSAKVWAEYLKAEYLPEEDDDDLQRLVTKPFDYRKWEFNPRGERILVGSSTDLTPYGFGQYLEQIYALGGSLGVQFSASPKEVAGR